MPDPIINEVISNYGDYTSSSGADISRSQQDNGYSGPSPQEPSEPWWHFCEREKSWNND
jgi:hypothetical protein